MTSVGLISDVHATADPVKEALAIFANEGVREIFCAGDIAGYREQLEQTVGLLVESGCHSVLGNHDLVYLYRHTGDVENTANAYLKRLPISMSRKIAGKRVYMVHAQPPYACHGGIKLLNKEGKVEHDRVAFWTGKLENLDYDVLVVGHTHQVFAEWIGDTLVVNPGSSAFNHSCAILHLPEMRVQFFSLSGREIERTWNWGIQAGRG